MTNLYDQLVSYLECLRFNFQFGFPKGYSTEYTILETLENLKSAIDDQKLACGIFCRSFKDIWYSQPSYFIRKNE